MSHRNKAWKNLGPFSRLFKGVWEQVRLPIPFIYFGSSSCNRYRSLICGLTSSSMSASFSRKGNSSSNSLSFSSINHDSIGMPLEIWYANACHNHRVLEIASYKIKHSKILSFPSSEHWYVFSMCLIYLVINFSCDHFIANPP